MVVKMPLKGTVNTEPPDMVRVQLKPNDIRSYRRRDAEEILAANAGAFIVGELDPNQVSQVEPGEIADLEAYDAAVADGTVTPEPKAKRAAPNKARQAKARESQPADSSQAETKAD